MIPRKFLAGRSKGYGVRINLWNPIRLFRLAVLSFVVVAHAAIILGVRLPENSKALAVPARTVMKLVDVGQREHAKPVKPPAAKIPVARRPPVASETPVLPSTPSPSSADSSTAPASEPVEESGASPPAIENPFAKPEAAEGTQETWASYMAPNRVSKAPTMPESMIRKRIKYPENALRAKIEGVVFLELYIDEKGKIRRIVVLKEDPQGKGFAEAAIRALDGITCAPAEANGRIIAVRYRYPVRFAIR